MNGTLMHTNTNRGTQFIKFAKDVLTHVDTYTIPQYGDAPDDMVESWSAEHVRNQMDKYIKRMANNGRGHEDNLLSCLKISHYACILMDKLKTEAMKKC